MQEQPERSSIPAFEVLISADAIARRIRELGDVIGAEQSRQGEPFLLVAVLEGAQPFASALSKAVPGHLPVHGIRASSYGRGTESSGTVTVTGGDDVPMQKQHILLLEDIVDTGRTVDALGTWFLERGAASVRVAALLDKPSRRVVGGSPDFVGFAIPDRFVIGFGMDVAGRYRELPHVAIWDPALDPQA